MDGETSLRRAIVGGYWLLYLGGWCGMMLVPRWVLAGGTVTLVSIATVLTISLCLPVSAREMSHEGKPGQARVGPVGPLDMGNKAHPEDAAHDEHEDEYETGESGETARNPAHPAPALEREILAYYAPAGSPYGPIPPGTAYTPTGRYGWGWLQAEFAGHGQLWVPLHDLSHEGGALPAVPNFAPVGAYRVPLPETVIRPGEQAPRLLQDTEAFFAPEPWQPANTILPWATPYDLIARAGWDWLQADFAGQGVFWVRSGDLGLSQIALTGLPNVAPVERYLLYLVAPGDDLRSLSERSLNNAGSSYIGHYNRVSDPLVPGRPLIVPVLQGRTCALSGTNLLIKRGNPAFPRIVLTVDVEGGDVGPLLQSMREHHVRATFFVTGWWAKSHPDQLRQIVADGHELGNHSLSHPDFRRLSNEQIVRELAMTEEIVREIAGATTRPYFRPPYGGQDHRVRSVVIAQGYLPVFWTVDSQDAIGGAKSAEFLAQRITSHLPPERLPGAIMLSHCCADRHRLAEALPAIVERFAAMGIEIAPLGRVLGE